MFFVFGYTVFCCLQVHRPAVFPVMGFAGSVVQDVSGITVLQASNGNPVEFNGFEELRSGTAILELFHALVGEQQT